MTLNLSFNKEVDINFIINTVNNFQAANTADFFKKFKLFAIQKF